MASSQQRHEEIMQQHQQRRPSQKQEQPGTEHKMTPAPIFITDEYKGSGKLQNQVAIITGGDSGIGRATAVHFAREGADVAILYLSEHKDAEQTKELVEKEGRRCEIIAGDVGSLDFCKQSVEAVIKKFGLVDVLVNNAAEQHVEDRFENISAEQLERTFRTNIFGYFFMAQSVVPHMKKGSKIINMTSVTAFKGNKSLIDYSSTKGAIVAFTRSLASNLWERGIRVNAIAPGPIWTPLIPATFDEDHVKKFGSQTLMERAGQPAEVATCCVFYACNDSAYITGDIMHPNGGQLLSS